MTAKELLRDLEKHDVRLTSNGGQLRIDAPCGVITDELRRDLETLKPELIVLMLARNSIDTAAGVADMTLDEFAKAGLIVQVWSEYLGCEVVFVSDDVPETALADIGLPIYRASELCKLAILSPAPRGLRMVHDVKTIFDGTIVDHEGPAGMVAKGT